MKCILSVLIFYFLGTDALLGQTIIKQFTKNIIAQDTLLRRTCISNEVDEYLIKSGKKTRHDVAFEEYISKFISENKSLRTQEDTFYIPVIVHVVHNGENVGVSPNISASQVYSQIDVLNEDFNRIAGTLGYNNSLIGASMKIKFVRAVWSPSGSQLAEPGIHRYHGNRPSWNTIASIETFLKPSTQWNPQKYLNIWTLKFGGSLSKTLGYAQFPSLSNLPGLNANAGSANTDGIVIRYNVFGRVGDLAAPYNKGRTTTHEMGHFWGLIHIWGDDKNCNTTTDYCDDTPKVNTEHYGCPTDFVAACVATERAMVENYMDYTDDACMNIFTSDQKNRIMAVLANSPRRKELTTSNVHIASLKPQAYFGTNTKIGCVGTPITFYDSSKMAPTSWDWKLYNASGELLKNNSSQIFSHIFTATGTYSVQLIVTNSHGSDTIFKKNVLHIISNQTLNLPHLESFESSTLLSNWVLYNPSADSVWKTAQNISAFGLGNQCIVYNNYDSTYDKTGFKNGFISPKISFPTDSNAYLEFDYAYSKLDSYADTLTLLFSTDCGKTFKSFWKRGGDNLATAPAKSSKFVPSTYDWRKEQVSLHFLNGQPSVHFMFQNTSGWGNALYIDNVHFFVPRRTAAPLTKFETYPSRVCVGNTVVFSDYSTQYPTSWNWNIVEKNNNASPITSNQQHFLVEFNIPGTYHVSLTASNSMGSGNNLTKNNQLSILNLPKVSITSTSTFVNKCSNTLLLTASGALSYKWYDSKGKTVIGTKPVLEISPEVPTTYTVYGTDANGCVNTTYIDIDYLNDSCATSSQNYDSNYTLQIFPNPVTDLLYINHDSPLKYKIFNALGTMISSGMVENGKIETNHFLPGLYLIEFYNGKKYIYKKILKDN